MILNQYKMNFFIILIYFKLYIITGIFSKVSKINLLYLNKTGEKTSG